MQGWLTGPAMQGELCHCLAAIRWMRFCRYFSGECGDGWSGGLVCPVCDRPEYYKKLTECLFLIKNLYIDLFFAMLAP
jgi:hypothetical protein